METIIVNIIVGAVLVLFAVMAIGPMMIEIRRPGTKRGTVVRLPIREPRAPMDGHQAA